jgi:hypothetical protein
VRPKLQGALSAPTALLNFSVFFGGNFYGSVMIQESTQLSGKNLTFSVLLEGYFTFI